VFRDSASRGKVRLVPHRQFHSRLSVKRHRFGEAAARGENIFRFVKTIVVIAWWRKSA